MDPSTVLTLNNSQCNRSNEKTDERSKGLCKGELDNTITQPTLLHFQYAKEASLTQICRRKLQAKLKHKWNKAD